MKPKVHKGSLGAAANGGSHKLLVEVLILGNNRVKMASPLPFYVFHDSHARPGELIKLFFFCKKSLCKVVLFIVIFSLLQSYNFI